MRTIFVIAMVLALAAPAMAWRDAWQDDDGPRSTGVMDSSGVPVIQADPQIPVAMGSDGVPYQVLPGGLINLNTGEFIPR